MGLKLKVVKKKDLIKSLSTIGADEASMFLRVKENKNVKVTKAIFNKKQFRYHHPILQWDQKYKKIKI